MDGDGGRQVPTPSMNPQAQSHEALKAMTDAADPAGTQAVADGWAELAAGFTEAAEVFRRTMASSEGGWTGEAAEDMRRQLMLISRWSELTGQQYQAASVAIADQSGAADTAKTTMPPPVPYNPGQMIKDAKDSGNILEMAALPFRLYEQKQKHDAAHERAAEIVTNRDASFAASAGGVPRFIPPPSLTRQPEPEVEHAAGSVVTPPPRAPGPAATKPEQATSAAGAGPGFAGETPTPGPGFGSAPPPAGFPPRPGFGPVAGFGPGGARMAPNVPAARGPAAATPMDASAKGTQDGEPKRPEYLIAPEIEGMFGSDAMTSPPVIGEA